MSRAKSGGPVAFRPSSNVYDIRKDLFGAEQVKRIDSSMDFNRRHEDLVCPAGYEQDEKASNRCIFKGIPYPSWYKWYDPLKDAVMKSMEKEGSDGGVPIPVSASASVEGSETIYGKYNTKTAKTNRYRRE